MFRFIYIGCFILLGYLGGIASGMDNTTREMVEADWLREEERLGHSPTDVEVLESLFQRADNVIESWKHLQDVSMPDVSEELKTLKELRTDFNKLSREERLQRYLAIRHVLRRIVLSHPSLTGRPIAFMKQRRAIQQMFHEYSGYYYNFFGISGGGVYILPHPGTSFETVELTGKLPRGSYASPSLSWDGRTIYFAFCCVEEGERPWGNVMDASKLPTPPESAPKEFSYYTAFRSSFHLYAVDVDGKNLRQITYGIYDDVDPCELPDGRLVFMSTRRGGFIRCNSGFEPIETSTLHSVDTDGRNLTTLSWHETDEWHPSVRQNGRLLFTRWDYVDRDATLFHGIWTCNPDGTAPTHLLGSYTNRINAFYQPREIPNSSKIVCLAGAHHANVGGALILLNTEKFKRDSLTGEDSLEAVECLTPEIPYSEVDGQWAQSFYGSPLPLSEEHFLVSFSFDPLPGMGPGWYQDSQSGLYYFDRFGNKELLYRDEDISSVAPMLLNTPDGTPFTKRPPVVPSVCDEELAKLQLGEFYLTDVHQSQFPLPEDRPIKALRIFELLPKEDTSTGNVPVVGFAFSAPLRAYLGEVPVEADGSAYFRAPARRPLYFQAIDEKGRAVQGMRSNAYLQPGEKRACVGCHEPVGTSTPYSATPLAARRQPSEIMPSVTAAGPVDFPKLVQPVLDKFCVSCHSGEHEPDLRSTPTGEYTVAYESLRPYVRWNEWGGNSISFIVSRPGECGADASELLNVLEDENHRDVLPKTDEDYRVGYQRIQLWLDGNVPFYGSYIYRERR
ncbi:MAG: hypothetical protein Q4C70_09645 [Planctomycetia bacterium]|nr:hypothetical protein [Planctomycetia bacterium]